MSQPNDHPHDHDHDHDPDDTHVTGKLHPLLLPEVLRLIGPHLSQASNVACLRVCRTWQLNLSPFLFREVLLPKRSASGKAKATGKTSKRALRPLVSALQRNGYMIRALYCEDNTLLRQISSYCVHLETLVLGKVTSEVLPILRLNQGTLVRLELTPEKSRLSVNQPRVMREDQDDEGDNSMFTGSSSSSSASSSATSSPFLSPLPPLIPPLVPTMDLWLNNATHPTGINPKPDVPVKELLQTIMRLDRLEHLVLDHLGLSSKNDLFLPFFGFCRDHLKTLELHNNAVLDAPPHDLVFPKLHSLALVNCSMSMSNQLRMVAIQTPQLEHLSWIRQQFLIPLQVWADYRTYHANLNIGNNVGLIPGPFLSSLDISHSAVKDSMIAHCLDAHLQLEQLVARDCSYIGSRSVDAIKRFKNLQMLDLRDCPNITPGIAFYLLQGCSALRSLSLDRASAREFLEWSPEVETATWSSTQTLEELRVVFVGPLESGSSSSSLLSSFEVQQTIYRHLSKFTRLRLLNLGRSGAVKWSAKSVLDLSLTNGLDQLAQLTELREFDFCQMNHRLGMEEVKWMLAHWPRLERMAGYLNHDRDRAGFMESFVRHERPGIVLKHKLKYKKGLCKPKLWNRKL